MRSKKILSLLLAVVMCLSLLPISAVVEAAESVTFTALDGTAGANYEEGYENLLDGKKTEADGTKWCVGGITSFPGAYIVIEASKAVRISGYTFTTGNDNTTATDRNPKDWVLYGANDYDATEKTATWTAIHTVTNDTTMQDENYTSYSFATDENNTSYRYYKLSIAQTRGSACMQLSEMELSWEDVTLTAVDGTTNSKESEDYDKLIDGQTGTKWCYAVSEQPYIVMKSSTPITVTGYRFTTANDNAGAGKQRNPKDWVLYGSKDYDESTKTGTWTVIDQKTDNTTMQDVNYTPYDFFIDNTKTYVYYKLQITATPGNELMQLSEMEFYYQTGELVYNVTFDKNGGDTEAVPNLAEAGTGLPTTNPTRNGYVFEGWYTQNGTGGNWGSAFTADSEVTDDITVYAKWRSAVITYDKNGGDTEAEPNIAEAGSGLPQIEPTREGYYFGGWYQKDGADGDWGAMFTLSSTVTADMTVYARWYTSSVRKALVLPSTLPAAKYSALYFGRYPQSDLGYSQPTTGQENVDWCKGAHVPFGKYSYYQIEPLRWDVLSNDGDKMLLLTDKCVDNMHWSNDFYIKYYSNSSMRAFLNGYGTETDDSGNLIFKEDFSQGNSFIARAFNSTELPFITKTDVSDDDEEPLLDRVFLLSHSDIENTALGLGTKSDLACGDTMFARLGDRTIDEADWHSRNHNQEGYQYLCVDLNGNTEPQGNGNSTYNYLVRPAVTLDVSKLVLASDKDSGKPSVGYLAPIVYKDNNTYKLTVLDESRSDFSHTYVSRSGSAVTFNYANAKSGSNEYVSAVVINGDEVRYYGRLKNIAASADASGILTVTLPETFDYFAGDRLYVFNEQINDETELDLSSALQEVLIMTEVPIITFDNNGGETAADPQEIYYGGGLPTTEPTWQKYEFIGWFTKNGTESGDWGEELTADTVVTENITVYAKWRPVQVTFDDNDATTPPDVSVKGQGEGIPAKQPVKAGYLFGGWFTKNGMESGDWGEEFTADTIATKCMTVYAKWTPIDKNLTATFTILDGTEGNPSRAEGLDRLMDGYEYSKWLVRDFTEAYVVIKASDPVYLQSYTFVTANDTGTYPGRNPKDWVLYACNDYNTETGTGSWTQIHSVTDDTTMQGVSYGYYTFDITGNTTQYKYYKLNITKIGDADCLQLAELKMGYTRCLEHAWSVSSIAATCLYEGYETHTCSLCGVSDTFVVSSPLGHVAGADGKCSRCGISPEARVDGVDYLTVQEAVNAAAGKTVTVLHDVELSSTIQINDSTVTLDLNGYTISMVGNDRLIYAYSYDYQNVFTLTDSSVAKTGALSGGKANGNGGGVYVTGGITFNMTGGTIKNCTAKNGGGICVTKYAGFSMTGGTVSDCTAGIHGGGLYLEYSYQSISISLTGGTFMNNSAEYGGGISSNRSLSLENMNVKNNSAENYGGGIYQDQRTLALGSGTVIEGNNSETGGGIYGLSGAAVTLNAGSVIRNNKATYGYGGGIAIYVSATLAMNGGAVIENEASYYGGGVYVKNGNFNSVVSNINGGEIKGNTAMNGGGIEIDNSTVNINGGSIQNNSARNDGGGVSVTNGGVLNVKGGTISNNKATTGGGIYLTISSSAGLTNTNITANTAATGGGLYATSSAVTVNSGVTITGNTVTAAAGTIGAASNLYLKSGCVVTATAETGTTTEEGATTATPAASLIGVTLEDGTGNITAESESDYSAYFTSDVSGYVVSYADGVVKLGLPVPKLTLTQNAVTAENVPEGATLFVAVYSGDKLLSLYRGAATSGTTALNTLGLDLSGADKLSAFMWNGTSLSPLCGNTSITLGTD